MKTRQEMIYDFMLALAPTTTDKSKDMLKYYDSARKEPPDDFEEILCNSIYQEAACLADAYLEKL
jgi:hypothetical protein